MEGKCSAMRVIALVGPGGAGKTSLSESLLYASSEISRQGSVEAGTTVGDSSPEARARQSSTDPNLLRFQYMGDDYGLIDTPGSPGFSASGAAALGAADLPIVLVDPAPLPPPLADPPFRRPDSLG